MAERFLADRRRETDKKAEHSSKKPVKKAGRAGTTPKKKPSLKIIEGGKVPTVETGFFQVVASPPYGSTLRSDSKAINDDVIKKAAKMMEMDSYLVRNRMASEAPWVVRRFDEADPARKLVAKLLEIGIEAYSVTTEQLNEVSPPMRAKKVSLIGGGLRFEGDDDEEPIDLGWSDIFLIVHGRIRRKAVDEGKRKRKKTESAPHEELKDYKVMDFYSKEGDGVRVAEGMTDFSGLGKYMRSSSLLNLRWMLKGFKAASSPIVNDGYRTLGMVFRPPAGKRQPDIRRSKKPVEDPSYLDNSRHFNEYSILVQFHHKKLEVNP